jgi:hypothetical protein
VRVHRARASESAGAEFKGTPASSQRSMGATKGRGKELGAETLFSRFGRKELSAENMQKSGKVEKFGHRSKISCTTAPEKWVYARTLIVSHLSSLKCRGNPTKAVQPPRLRPRCPKT